MSVRSRIFEFFSLNRADCIDGGLNYGLPARILSLIIAAFFRYKDEILYLATAKMEEK